MNHAETLQQQLQHITGLTFSIVELTEEYEPWLPHVRQEQGRRESFIHEHQIFFPYRASVGAELAFVIEEQQLSARERKLVDAWLDGVAGHADATGDLEDDEEGRMRRLGRWALEQSILDEDQRVPHQLRLEQQLQTAMVPLLLTGEGLHSGQMNYALLQRFLNSYFGGVVMLVPLEDQEWFILAEEELVVGAEDERDANTAEQMEEVFTAFALGLYELVASEWVGVFHIAVGKSITPLVELPRTVSLLRETIHLGRIFHLTEHIHLPWELSLERMIYSIPDEQRKFFVKHAGNQSAMFEDAETLTTLETFFQMDCNVSETAKRLYVHRNTLIYRLDKIKQETGLDVRTFNDAVLARLILLLYKVTKSK
ncbi:Purine catabolism regulatory protein [compost metagenome]